MERAGEERLAVCMARARRGEELTIGFLGGSITQGSLAGKEENTYARRVYAWWKQTFPQAEFHYVNAGIGGTTSHYGAARAETDLLMYQPDVVVVDFSVNDLPDSFFQETYEGVIRRILTCASRPAVVLLGNVYYDSGRTAQEYHSAVARRYGLPYVSIRDTVYQRMLSGEYRVEELTPDGLHPGDRGHGLVAEELIRCLENVRAKAPMETEEPYAAPLPAPMTANAYEHAKRLTIRDCTPTLLGFRADTEEKRGHLDAFKNGWIGKKPGDRICFRVESSCIAVQYRKSVTHPALSARAVLDQDEEHPILLNGDFEEDWGDCQYLQPILHHGVCKEHTVELEIFSGQPEEAVPFYLMSLVVA